MMGDFEELRRRYADYFGRASAIYGLSPLIGRLYGTLLLAPQPMTLDQLTEAMGAAKSTVSVAMRNLERYRVVRRDWVRGDRRDFFVARTDFSAILKDWYRLFFQHEIRYLEEANADARETLRAVEDAPGWPSSRERDVILERLDEAERMMSAFQGWFEEFVRLVGEAELPPAEQIPIEVEK